MFRGIFKGGTSFSSPSHHHAAERERSATSSLSRHSNNDFSDVQTVRHSLSVENLLHATDGGVKSKLLLAPHASRPKKPVFAPYGKKTSAFSSSQVVDMQTSSTVNNDKCCFSKVPFHHLVTVEVRGFEQRIPQYLVDFVHVFLARGGLDKPWPRIKDRVKMDEAVHMLDHAGSVLTIDDSNTVACLFKDLVHRGNVLSKLPMDLCLEGFFTHKIHHRLTYFRMVGHVGEPELSTLQFVVDFLVLVASSKACCVTELELAHAFSALLWVPPTSLENPLDMTRTFKEITAILINMMRYSCETRSPLTTHLE